MDIPKVIVAEYEELRRAVCSCHTVSYFPQMFTVVIDCGSRCHVDVVYKVQEYLRLRVKLSESYLPYIHDICVIYVQATRQPAPAVELLNE